MTDKEKLAALRRELAGPLTKYVKYSAFEKLDSEHPDHVDSSYCYDMAHEWFEEDWPSYSTILAILAEEPVKNHSVVYKKTKYTDDYMPTVDDKNDWTAVMGNPEDFYDVSNVPY